MRNVSDKYCRGNNTYFTLGNTFSKKNRALYGIMWKKTVQQDRTHIHIFPCWITKATDTQSEYVILIAFLRQQKLHERALMLHLYVHCMYC